MNATVVSTTVPELSFNTTPVPGCIVEVFIASLNITEIAWLGSISDASYNGSGSPSDSDVSATLSDNTDTILGDVVSDSTVAAGISTASPAVATISSILVVFMVSEARSI